MPQKTAKKPAQPTPDGCRFCRHCNACLPLSAFPVGARRYVCKTHMYELVKRPAKLRVEADDKRRAVAQLWARCRTDSKVFGQPRVALTQSDIEDLILASGRAVDLAVAVVPADAGRVLSRENAVVLGNEARHNLTSAYRAGGERMYRAVLAAFTGAGQTD